MTILLTAKNSSSNLATLLNKNLKELLKIATSGHTAILPSLPKPNFIKRLPGTNHYYSALAKSWPSVRFVKEDIALQLSVPCYRAL